MYIHLLYKQLKTKYKFYETVLGSRKQLKTNYYEQQY
jgi:hypothetical protein